MKIIDRTQAPSPASGRDLSALQFQVVPFAEEHLPLVRVFSERYWVRPRTESFYHWRYIESQRFSRMFLAVTDDECLGMVFAFEKTYLVAGEPTVCLEIFDWHSLPGLSGTGVGIRVMRAMMRDRLRLLGIGGTADVLKTLPAMRWQTADVAYNYELPLSSAALVDGLRRRMPMRLPGERLLLDAAVASWFRRAGRRRRPAGGEAIPVATLGPEVDALYTGDTGYHLLQRPNREWLRWLTGGYAGAGSFRYWYFVVKGRLRGWALTRVYDTERGREGAIVDIFAPNPDHALYQWMVSEVAASLAGEALLLIRARATCPIFRAALRASRFLQGDSVPVFTFPSLGPDAGRLHITLDHTDACLRPYPTSPVFRDDGVPAGMEPELGTSTSD